VVEIRFDFYQGHYRLLSVVPAVAVKCAGKIQRYLIKEILEEGSGRLCDARIGGNDIVNQYKLAHHHILLGLWSGTCTETGIDMSFSFLSGS
jgi:hypothetical protein